MGAVLIIIGIIIFIIAFVLWSTVTFDIATNGKKTIVTVSMYRFIKREFVYPGESNEQSEEKAEPPKPKKQKKTEEPETEEEPSKFRQELKSLWDSDIHWFDFENIYEFLDKYLSLMRHGSSALAVFLRWMKLKVRAPRLDLYIRFGLGSPDKTGVAYGAAHGCAGTLNSVLKSCFKTDEGLVLYLDPDYVNSCFEFELGSIIKTRAAHVLHALVAALVRFIINYLRGSGKNVNNFRHASD